jgi:5-methylcytosine-specific restriction protein A
MSYADRIYTGKRKSVPPRVRAAVKERDGACVACGSTVDLTVDHIKAIRSGGSNEPENLQTLCKPCNVRKRDHTRVLAPGEKCSDPKCGHLWAGDYSRIWDRYHAVDRDAELVRERFEEAP